MGKKVNKAELEEILGVSHQALTDWQQEEPPLPIKERAERRGQSHVYDTADVIAWYVARQLRSVQAESQRDRLARLQADEVELRLMERRGALVPADQVEPLWLSLVTSAKNFLRAEPVRLAHLMGHAETVDARISLLTEAFDEFLTKLSTLDPDDDDEPIDGSHHAGGQGQPASSASQGGSQAGSAAEDVGGEMG